jgi:hypothetical protein
MGSNPAEGHSEPVPDKETRHHSLKWNAGLSGRSQAEIVGSNPAEGQSELVRDTETRSHSLK